MTSTDANEIIFIAKKSFRDWFAKALENFNSHARDRFSACLIRSDNTILTTELQDGMDYIYANHKAVVRSFEIELEILFTGTSETIPKTIFEDLKLLDDVQVENYIEQSKMASWLLDRHRVGIKEIEARFNFLKNQGGAINPKALSPGKLLEAMFKSFDAYKLSDNVRKIYMQAFEEKFLPGLLDAYILVNNELLENGINLELEFKNIKSHQKFMRIPEASDVYRQRELLETLTQYKDKLSTLNNDQLLNGELRKRLMELLPQSPQRQSTDNEIPTPAPNKKLAQSDSRQIEFVERVIVSLATDTTIDQRVRNLIQSLMVPVTMLALSDAELFSNSNHPGRMLIRELTLFGNATPDAIDRHIDHVSQRIADICRDDMTDKKLVTQVTDEIYRINESIVDDLIKQSKVDREGRLKKLRQQEAKYRVVLELREQLVHHYLPDELRPGVLRILGPWMAVRYLKYGRSSRPWLESLAYMQLYFKAIEPAQNIENLKRRFILRKHLITTARKKTEKSRLPRTDIDALLQAFETYVQNLNDIDELRLQSDDPVALPEIDEPQMPIATDDLGDEDLSMNKPLA